MGIAEILTANNGVKIKPYFNEDRPEPWIDRFNKKILKNEVDHDEPWLTLVSLYALFGDQSNLKSMDCIFAINALLTNCGLNPPPKITEIINVKIEKSFPEIMTFRAHLKQLAVGPEFHHYPDRMVHSSKDKKKPRVSYEGNTKIDVFINAKSGSRDLYFLIEAKFLSDISYQIKYSPVRDQISRNIDTGLDYIKNEKKLCSFDSLYFLMLTPRQFRTEPFGGNANPPLREFHPERSRLYCYKMNDFKKITLLKEALPHRNELIEDDWKQISNNLGWITYEDIYQQANNKNTMEKGEDAKIWDFFNERNLTEGLPCPK